MPSDTANLDRDHVKGLITEVGGSNSHCAILARSFSLPAILGAEDAMTQIQDGQDLILDGLTGQIWLDFSQEEKEQYEQKRQLWKKQIEEEQTYLLRPGATKDEVKIALGINVGSDAYDTAGRHMILSVFSGRNFCIWKTTICRRKKSNSVSTVVS